MKFKVLLFALVVFGLGSCTQRTCPTYTKLDVQQQQGVAEHTEAARNV